MYTLVDMLQCRGRAVRVKAENVTVTERVLDLRHPIEILVVSNICYFHSYLERWTHFDEHVFQLGWNHQLGILLTGRIKKKQTLQWFSIL